ncbi:MAG TPA: membrane dipeptidase [Geobacteraceae bacterium]|nr:membrane dipeptidase [Geobacteraceae bacterium]
MEKPAAYPVFDSHVDLLFDLIRHHPDIPLEQASDAWVSPAKLADGGVRVVVSAFYCMDSFNGPATAADNLRYLLEYAEANLRIPKTIRTAEDLDACYRGSAGPGKLLLLENSDALLEFPPEGMKRRGFRVAGLTHADRNRIGDGNSVANPEGFSSRGRELVRELDSLGFAIDAAHLSDPCFREVAGLFSGPIISTHTGLRALCDTPRNLSDEQVGVILSRGGMVGIAAYPGMLTIDGRADISHVFRHIDHVVQKYGPSGVGVGSDFGGYDTVCEGFEDHSRIPSLAALLVGAGYTDSAVRGIMGDNWYRFFVNLLKS